jgi:glycosyltransferase involved in cell wall biosynthesis
VRHYRGLEKMGRLLEEYFAKYNFSPIADYLNLELTTSREKNAEALGPASPARSLTTNAEPANVQAKVPRCGVTLVVPCYNEESVLPYLRNTLDSVRELLEERYELSFIFVDDCSTDQTRTKLEDLFGAQEDCRIISHERNQGVAAAILTGIRNASTEVVCSIDCDCTYDPHELGKMIPRLTAGVALVTASPYHPFGQVRNVPEWRLALSRISSWLYRRVLRQKLFTYTSCFRVYRRSAVVEMKPTECGFLGIAELLGLIDLAGLRIVEHPATLEVRLFGQSKMKILKTIVGHLRLLSRFVVKRLQSPVTDWQPSGHTERVSSGKSRQSF